MNEWFWGMHSKLWMKVLYTFCILLFVFREIFTNLPLFFSRNIANKMSWFTQLLPKKVIFCVVRKLSWTNCEQRWINGQWVSSKSSYTLVQMSPNLIRLNLTFKTCLRTITKQFQVQSVHRKTKTLEWLLLIFMLHSHILRFYVCFRQAIKTESKLTQQLTTLSRISISSLFSQVIFGYPHAFVYTPMKKLIFAALIILEMPRYWTLKQRKYARKRSIIVCSLIFLCKSTPGKKKLLNEKEQRNNFLTWIKFYEKETNRE